MRHKLVTNNNTLISRTGTEDIDIITDITDITDMVNRGDDDITNQVISCVDDIINITDISFGIITVLGEITPLYFNKELVFVHYSYNRLCFHSNRKTVHHSYSHSVFAFSLAKVRQDCGRGVVKPLATLGDSHPACKGYHCTTTGAYVESLCVVGDLS